MRTRTDNSFMPRIGIAQIAIESKTCPSDSIIKCQSGETVLTGKMTVA